MEPTLEKVRELRLPETARKLALSPSGRLAFSADYPAYDLGSRGRRNGFEVELADGGFVSVAGAAAVEFVDDERLVALVEEEGGAVLRLLRLAAEPLAEMEVPLPALAEPRLRLESGGERWEVIGKVGDGREMLRLEGDLAGSWEEAHRLALPQEGDGAAVVLSYLNSAGRLLTVEQTYALGGALDGSYPGLLLAMLSGTSSTTRIATRDAAGSGLIAETSRMLTCFEPAFAQSPFLCATLGEVDAQLWWIDAERRRLEPIGSLPELQTFGPAAAAAGRRVLLASYGGPLVLVDPPAGRAWRIDRQILAEPAVVEVLRPPGGEMEGWHDAGEDPAALLSRFGAPTVALGSGLLAVAIPAQEGSPVVVYRQPDV